MRSVPQLAIWDDHDFGLNNSDATNPQSRGLPSRRSATTGRTRLRARRCPGVFFQYAYGGVDFFMLDGRYYRTPNADAGRAGQDAARRRPGRVAARGAARRSRAPFKVLVCGSGWSAEDGPPGDTWAAFLTERNELFDFIRDARIEGVFLLSGDTHFGEVNCMPVVGARRLRPLRFRELAARAGDRHVASWSGSPRCASARPVFRSVQLRHARLPVGARADGHVLAARPAGRRALGAVDVDGRRS